MWPVVIDRVVWSACLSVTIVSPAKMAEPIDMLFGLWARMGPRKHALDGSLDSPMGRDNFACHFMPQGRVKLMLMFTACCESATHGK